MSGLPEEHATMTTEIELDRDGTRRVFHRTASKAWTHPIDEPCEACATR